MQPQAKAEWDAWQLVVKHWPGNIDDPQFNTLVKAIQLWGEYLVALRVTQDEAMRDKARADYHARYNSSLTIR